jgi:HEPN domain-containing protein
MWWSTLLRKFGVSKVTQPASYAGSRLLEEFSMSGPEPGFLAWLKKAENDLLNIENNLAAPRVPWDTVCYHAQQAAEKLLKAFLVYHNLYPPHIHDLVALLGRCAQYDHTLGTLEGDCGRLTYYSVSVRYPDLLYDPDEEDTRALVEAVYRIQDAIIERLPELGNDDKGSL